MSLYTFSDAGPTCLFLSWVFDLRDVGGGGEMRVWGRVLVCPGWSKKRGGGSFSRLVREELSADLLLE